MLFPYYFLGVFFSYSPTSPTKTILLDAFPFHNVFWDIHCFAVSSPSFYCFLLELVSEFILHHASKCSPYPVPSLCIHWLHIVHPIILPVYYITSNLGSSIFPKCGACTCPSYRVSFLHILVNPSLSCFLQ